MCWPTDLPLPPGVEERQIDSLEYDNERTQVRCTTWSRLPPRYKGYRRLPDYNTRELAAEDEQFISYMTGDCYVTALPRTQRTTWSYEGGEWKVIAQKFPS
jgi:hypothetical protein